MIRPLFAFLLLASAEATAAPFGTSIGMSKSDLGIGADTVEISTYKYHLSKLPKTSKLFESYVVKVTPDNGLCYFKAIGVNINTSAYGSDLKAEFTKVNKSLQKKYIKGDTLDYLSGGSIWKEPRHFMMGLLKKERFLKAYYDPEEGSTMVESVQKAILSGSALSSDTGFISLEYYFDNHDSCNSEIEAIEEDVF